MSILMILTPKMQLFVLLGELSWLFLSKIDVVIYYVSCYGSTDIENVILFTKSTITHKHTYMSVYLVSNVNLAMSYLVSIVVQYKFFSINSET